MGNKKQLKNMINRCRENGLRIYSELVINQMSGNRNDIYENHKDIDYSTWGPKTGSAGSSYWTTRGLYENNIYTGLEPVLECPAIPYFASDFHCYRDIVISFLVLNEINEFSKLKYTIIYWIQNGYIWQC